MKKENIRVGMKLKIVGGKGGCMGGKCNKCSVFRTGIVVTDLDIKNMHPHTGKRCIGGTSLENDRSKCVFNPDDLEIINIVWKEELS